MGTLYSRANPLGYKQWAPGLEKPPLEPCILAPWFTQIKNAFCVFNYAIHYLHKVLLVISTKDGAWSITYMNYFLNTALRNSERVSNPRIVFGLSISKWLFAAAIVFYILSLLLPLSLLVFSPYLNVFALVFLIKTFLFSGCNLSCTRAVQHHQLCSLPVWETLRFYFRKILLILVDLKDTIRQLFPNQGHWLEHSFKEKSQSWEAKRPHWWQAEELESRAPVKVSSWWIPSCPKETTTHLPFH